MEQKPVDSIQTGIEPSASAATPRVEAPRDMQVEHSENAVFPADSSELNVLMELIKEAVENANAPMDVPLTETIAQLEPIIGPDGEELDFDNLEAAAAGGGQGGGGDGSGFVRLGRIAEGVTPLQYNYTFSLEDTPDFDLGSANDQTSETDEEDPTTPTQPVPDQVPEPDQPVPDVPQDPEEDETPEPDLPGEDPETPEEPPAEPEDPEEPPVEPEEPPVDPEEPEEPEEPPVDPEEPEEPPVDPEEPEEPEEPPVDPEDPKGGPKGNNGVGNGEDPQPPGNPPINDGPGTGPGNPGNQGGSNGGNNNGGGNSGNSPSDPVDDSAGGRNPGNDKEVGNSPWDGETGASGKPGNGKHQDGIDTDTNQPGGREKGQNVLIADDLLDDGPLQGSFNGISTFDIMSLELELNSRGNKGGNSDNV
jgi:hypothetical protein